MDPASVASAAPRRLIIAALAGLLVGVPAGYVAGGAHSPPTSAHQPRPPAPKRDMDHAATGHVMAPPVRTGPETPAQKAFREANDRMHAAMAAPSSGDVDLDFARGMLPHHQGAVDMANIQLRYGTDPEMKSLAIKVVQTQKEEIRQMEEWIAKREKAPR